MSNNRKEVLINLCRKVGYFLLEQEKVRVQSPLSGCQECIMIQIHLGYTVNIVRFFCFLILITSLCRRSDTSADSCRLTARPARFNLPHRH